MYAIWGYFDHQLHQKPTKESAKSAHRWQGKGVSADPTLEDKIGEPKFRGRDLNVSNLLVDLVIVLVIPQLEENDVDGVVGQPDRSVVRVQRVLEAKVLL